MHTLFSDGKLSVPQLLQHCRNNNVKYMGITDHDTVKAVIDWKNNNYQANREENEVIVIPGIELSAFLGLQLANSPCISRDLPVSIAV